MIISHCARSHKFMFVMPILTLCSKMLSILMENLLGAEIRDAPLKVSHACLSLPSDDPLDDDE